MSRQHEIRVRVTEEEYKNIKCYTKHGLSKDSFIDVLFIVLRFLVSPSINIIPNTIDNNVGTPRVEIVTEGEGLDKRFHFSFKISLTTPSNLIYYTITTPSL